MFDKFNDECGVFAIYGSSDASVNTALGLHALQHRGQEAAGIVSFDTSTLSNPNFHFADGLVSDNFTAPEILKKLTGDIAIGHVRYSTAGKKTAQNYQPIIAELELGFIAVAHNGNLTNAKTLRSKLIKRGAIFQTTMDTEVILHLIALSKKLTLAERFIDALSNIQGAYSLVCMTKDEIFGIRDPLGIRPLILGKLENSWVLASETCAFDIIGAEFIRNVEPGEIIYIKNNQLESYRLSEKLESKFCIFEFIYFSRPDSIVENQNVYEVRKNIGAQLYRECGVEADVVIPVPDSGVPAAMGYSSASGIPFELGIIRNHYIGRTFIQPSQQVRDVSVKLKHNINRKYVEGKRIVLVDDSIVRGTTSIKIVNMLREAGAKEIHMRIASPPTKFSCYYGVDTPQRDKLIAATHSLEEMNNYIGTDSLGFISIEGVRSSIKDLNSVDQNLGFCDACFTGNYPIKINN